jgi:copper chaperone NosL
MRHFSLKIIIVLFLVLIFSHLRAEDIKITTCAKCGNEIKSENKKYSIIQLDAEKPVSFDDIGHAVLWRENQCTAIQMSFDATAKVYDFNTQEELDISSAFFIINPDIKSPGGSGIAAFKDKQSAEKFISDKDTGKILTYDDLLLLNLK